MVDYSDKIIRKPWGFEWICYNDPDGKFMVTMLHIVPGRGTSFHKHMRKDTELIALSGGVKVHIRSAKAHTVFTSKIGTRFTIPVGTPHQTTVDAPAGTPTSEDGIWVMEIERPPDKEDLVRLEDEYHRDSNYEGEENWVKHPANPLSLTDKKQRFLDWDIWVEDGEVKLERVKNVLRVSDYIFQRIAKEGIEYVFGVVGGGSMHLSDSVGNTDGITYIPCHHEQAAAMAAEGYARYSNKPGVVVVTTGPGGTNAITGVDDCWIDSVPLIVISGQVTRNTMIGDSSVRQLGLQETDIISLVHSITKYSETLTKAEDIKHAMDVIFEDVQHGRPGPCWLDVPLDLQGAMIEPDEIPSLEIEKDELFYGFDEPEGFDIEPVIDALKEAKRPVIIGGKGIHNANALEEFRNLVDVLGIPVVLSWSGKDMLWQDHPLFVGTMGIMGERSGNFAVQNADLILSIGSRLSLPQIGYNYEMFAREAKIIMVDIDEAELSKKTLQRDGFLGIHADCKEFIDELKVRHFESVHLPLSGLWYEKWAKQCQDWKAKYPVYNPEYANGKDGINCYHFLEKLSDIASDDSIIVTDIGASFTATHQAWKIKKGQRLLTASGHAPMGCALPMAIGAHYASGKPVIAIVGDGGIMMNLQELATIAFHKLPICIFLLDNSGYLTIKLMQTNHFGRFVGSTEADLGFPDWRALVDEGGAFPEIEWNDMAFYGISDIDIMLKDSMNTHRWPILSKVPMPPHQPLIPRNTSEKRPDGTMVSKPLEDMYPFLPRDEFKSNMIVKTVDILGE